MFENGSAVVSFAENTASIEGTALPEATDPPVVISVSKEDVSVPTALGGLGTPITEKVSEIRPHHNEESFSDDQKHIRFLELKNNITEPKLTELAELLAR